MRCTTVRVRYAETDAMQIAYHANYFVWFEVGRSEWFRLSGMSYRHVEPQGVILPVVEASCRYRSPARYDDLIAVHVDVSALSPTRIEFSYRLTRVEDNAELAEGRTSHPFVTALGRPVNLRKFSPQLWQALSAAVADRQGGTFP